MNLKSPQLLTDKVAIVTGGARGIGKAIAQIFLDHGAYVAIVDIDAKELEETSEALKNKASDGSRVSNKAFDVSDEQAFDRFADEVVREYGKLDILVCNAAIEIHIPLFKIQLSDWEHLIRNNLTAYFTCAKIAARKMVASSVKGRIVNVGSIQSKRSEPGSLAYAVSKAGVDQLTRSLAMELAPFGITVNCVNPGFIKTRLSIREDGEDETETDLFKKYYIGMRKIPLGRVGAPEDVANAVLFFASDLCSYVTGASLAVDGGLSITL